MSQPVDRNIIVREILKRSNLDPDDMLDIMAEIGNITPLFQEIQNAEKEKRKIIEESGQDPAQIRIISEMIEKLEVERSTAGRYGGINKIDDLVSLLSPTPYTLPTFYTGSNTDDVQVHIPSRGESQFEKVNLVFQTMFPGSTFNTYGSKLKSRCGNYANYIVDLSSAYHRLTDAQIFTHQNNPVFGLKDLSTKSPGGDGWMCRNCLTTIDYDEQDCACPRELEDGKSKFRKQIKVHNSPRIETIVLSSDLDITDTKQFNFPLDHFVNTSFLEDLEIGVVLTGFTRTAQKLGVSREITYRPSLGYKMHTKGILFEVNELPEEFIDVVFSNKVIVRDVIIDLIHDKVLAGMKDKARQIFEIELFLSSCIRTLQLDQYDDGFDIGKKLNEINDPAWIDSCILEFHRQEANWEGTRQGLTDDVIREIFTVVSDAGFTEQSIQRKIRELVMNSLAQLLYLNSCVTSGSNFDDIDFLVRRDDDGTLTNQIIMFDSTNGANGACELVYELLTAPQEPYVFGNRTELSKPKYFDEGFTEMLLPCPQGVTERIFYQDLHNLIQNNRSVGRSLMQLESVSQENPEIAQSIRDSTIFNLFATFTGLRDVLGQDGTELGQLDSYRLKNATDVCIHGCPDCISIGSETKTHTLSERFSISKYLLDLLFRFHTSEIRITDNFDMDQIENTLRKYNMVILTRTLADPNQTADDLETLVTSLIGKELDNKLYKISGKWIDCPISNSPSVEVSYLISLIDKPSMKNIPEEHPEK